MQDYKQLEVWRRSHAVVVSLYRATQLFPREERYGLTSQIRRAAVSIPANIAEGARRASGREYAYHVNVAQGSRSELQYLIQLAAELSLLEQPLALSLDRELDELGRMLHRLRQSIVRDANASAR